MKFGQIWKNELSSMPMFLQDKVINYKKYKKVSKATDTETIKNMITNDIKNCESVYRHIHKRATSKHNTCFARPPIDTQIVVRFAKLNKQCIYKLCKRIDKRNGVNVMTCFYNQILMDPRLHMFSRKEQVLLDIGSAFETNTECPICLEQFHGDVLVLDCGHIVCLDCSLGVHGAKHTKGTVHNRIAHGAYLNRNASKCPVCQSKRAFQNFEFFKV